MTTQIFIYLTPDKQTPQSALRRLIWVSPLAMLTATAANLGLYTAAGSVYPEVTAWPGAGPAQIVGANIVYLLLATIVFAVIARRSSRPARTYTIVATIALLLSLALPISAAFGTPPAGAATVVTLSLMHVMTYAISVPMFIRLALD
jgi:hypothetical protein